MSVASDAAITVDVDEHGHPAPVTWLWREPAREVVNQWRADDDRWRVPISRTYCTVIMPTIMLEIYRDDIAVDWYLQRVID